MDTDFVAFSSPWKVLSHATRGTQVGQMTASYKSIVFETDQQPVKVTNFPTFDLEGGGDDEQAAGTV